MKRLSDCLRGTALFLSMPLLLSAPARASDSTEQTWDYVRVAAVAKDQLSMDVEVAPFNDCKRIPSSGQKQKCQQLHLVVKEMVVRDRLKQLHPGDRIKITFAFGENNQNVLKVFCLDTAPEPEPHTRIWVLLVSAAACFVLYWLFSIFKPLRLIIGEDNRYSNSKFQMAVWFFALITTYAATLWLRVWYAGCDFIGGVNIPQNLLLLTGMSVLTFGGAKAITTSKVAGEIAKGGVDPKKRAGVQPNFLRDLTHDDGKPAVGNQPAIPPQLDFGDLQMLVITLIAVGTYLALVFNFLDTIETSKVVSLPDVDTTILAAFGLGHGAYLTKKAAGTVGQS